MIKHHDQDNLQKEKFCLGQCCFAVKRPHGNSSKRKDLIGVYLQFQRVCLLSSWQHTGRPGAGELAERTISGSAGSIKRDCGLGMRFLKPQNV